MASFYGPKAEKYWSFNKGSQYLTVPNLIEQDEFRVGMSRNISTKNGFYLLKPSASGPGGLTLERSNGKNGADFEKVIDYKTTQVAFSDKLFHWKITEGCLLAMYAPGETNPVYAASQVNMYFGFTSPST